MKLNKQQEEATNHVDGPCLVVAVPGSGKTRILVERIGRLVDKGIPQQNIVCMTFTNKAADEMRERICKRLGTDRPKAYVGTFHKMCVGILRRFGEKIGYTPSFAIVDSNDQQELVKQSSRRLGIDLERRDVFLICKGVNNYRENQWGRDELDEALNSDSDFIAIADLYLDHLKKTNSIDFSGLLSESIELLRNHKDVLERIQTAMKYIQVDEVQDTNFAQFELIKMFMGKWKNIVLVGDVSQCVVGDTKISTKCGKKFISEVIEGDEILCGAGCGKTTYNKISRVSSRRMPLASKLIKIKTNLGKEMISTPEHIYFAGFKPLEQQYHFVYLMYREDLGYRVGTTKMYSNNSNHGRMGFVSRSLGETADKVWVISVHNTEKEARFHEQYFSVQYGLPTWTFRAHGKGDNIYGKKQIDKLFSWIDTYSNASDLMSKYGLNQDYPHYSPKSMSIRRRRNFSITLCGDNRVKPLHCYAISGSDNDDVIKLSEIGIKVRPSKKCKGWRIEGANSSLEYLESLYDKVKSVIKVNLIEQARFTNKSLPFMPAESLRKGMTVFVEKDGIIIEDIIDSVEDVITKEDQVVYDIDVDRCHNFVGNGILTHNSIYRFRGARYQNISDFLDDNTGCKVVELPLNYRSTPEIILAADNLIRNNSSHMAKEFITDNPTGEDVKCLAFRDQMVEADFVASHIKRMIDDGGWVPGDIAVLYRTNAMSQSIEQSMANAQIAYKVIGGRSFYDRKEIRDCLALLKIASNPRDCISFSRLCKMVPGIGDKTIGAIESLSLKDNLPIHVASKQYALTVKRAKIRESLDSISSKLSKDYSKMTARDCLESLVDKFQIESYLISGYGEDNGAERMDNVNQLISSAGEFVRANNDSSVSSYLQAISLMSSSDEKDEKERVSLMTLHASKGLEFPVVFMIGVEEKILPHALSEDEVDGIEEERRLCYVGMTRAEKLLVMTFCHGRRQYGRGNQTWVKASKPSRFLSEAQLLDND